MKMKSAVVMSQGEDIAIMDLELDDPKANEVLIKTVASGLCHTDLAGRDAGMALIGIILKTVMMCPASLGSLHCHSISSLTSTM